MNFFPTRVKLLLQLKIRGNFFDGKKENYSSVFVWFGRQEGGLQVLFRFVDLYIFWLKFSVCWFITFLARLSTNELIKCFNPQVDISNHSHFKRRGSLSWAWTKYFESKKVLEFGHFIKIINIGQGINVIVDI